MICSSRRVCLASSITCLVVAVLWANAARAQCPLFAPARLDFGSYQRLSDVAIGDLNGDGAPDIAVTDQNADGLRIRLGTGNGMFKYASMGYAVGHEPSSLALTDFNGDGRRDVAVTNAGTDDVSVLLGNGNGTFGALANYPAGTAPESVAVADLNGDGTRDLAVANKGSDDVSILLGSGDGTFLPALSFAVGDSPVSVAVGDFNGDGRRDLAVVNSGSGVQDSFTGSVSILRGYGNGTFAAAVPVAAGSFDNPSSVAVGDFDGNGREDLAVTSNVITDFLPALATDPAGVVAILRGNGNGSFSAPVNYTVGWSPSSVRVGDFDGNGRQDLAVANQHTSEVSVLGGNGNGTFAAAVNYGVGTGPVSVAIGDFQGNGRQDLALAIGGDLGSGSISAISVLLGNGNGTFAVAPEYDTGRNPMAVVVGDFDADGETDFAVGNDLSCHVAIRLGNGDGTFVSAANVVESRLPCSDVNDADALSVGDLDGDGHEDLLISYSADTISGFRSNVDGTFSPFTALYVFSAFLSGPESTALGDFNEDGHTDFVAAVPFDGPFVFLGDGSGDFGVGGQVQPSSSAISVVVADFDQDGHQDLATVPVDASICCPLQDLLESVSIWMGNGDGTFDSPVSYLVGYSPGSLSVSDYDGNGYPDLAVPNTLSDYVSFLYNNGNGTFATAPLGFVNRPQSIAFGDFDADGILEMAVSNGSDNNILIHSGPGEVTFPGLFGVRYGTRSAFPAGVQAADFNGDGRSDLVVASRGVFGGFFQTGHRGGVSILLSQNTCRHDAFTVPGGTTVTTDIDADGATPDDPLEATVFSPNAGKVEITRTVVGTGPLQIAIHLTAPDATAADHPLVVTLLVDASYVPASVALSSIVVLKNGDPVLACRGAEGVADPNPCVWSRRRIAGGDVEIVVYTETASIWQVLVPLVAPPPTVTSRPVLPPPTPTPTPIPLCDPAPRENCRVVSKSSLLIRTGKRMLWAFKGGMSGGEMGDPVEGETRYALCVYDQSGGEPFLAARAAVEPGGVCLPGERACWRHTRAGMQFSDLGARQEGVRRISIGADGLRFEVAGARGLPRPAASDRFFAQDQRVTAQLVTSAGSCWEDTYEPGDVIKNAAHVYRARNR